MITNHIEFGRTFQNEGTVQFKTSDLSELQALMNKYIDGEEYTVEIKKKRRKRSLDANSYAWVLITKLAEAMRIGKEDVYEELLRRYSHKFTHMVLKPDAVDEFKSYKDLFRIVDELGKVKVNGTTGIQVRCYYGSSTFDTKEMSIFIDGIVSECKELGIPTETPDEIERMKSTWGTDL